ncbi:MAG: hypothetical protein M3452_05685 [Chloroflexota bacterium]|nr:hypothetical protein [Chloroflexota bacterium]
MEGEGSDGVESDGAGPSVALGPGTSEGAMLWSGPAVATAVAPGKARSAGWVVGEATGGGPATPQAVRTARSTAPNASC